MRTKMYWCGHLDVVRGDSAAMLDNEHHEGRSATQQCVRCMEKYPRVDISLVTGGSTMVLIGVNRAIEPTGRVAEVVVRNENGG
jgi:hypothetical protein